MNRLTAVLWCFLLCAVLPANAENVVFTDAMRRADDMAFHMDRMGDLYPPGEVPVNTAALLNGDPERGSIPLESREFATLRALYRWEASRNSPQWQALINHASIETAGDFQRDWLLVQQTLRQRVAERINAIAASHVVLPVHGFNNSHDESSKWYQTFEEAVLKSQRDVAFVRMYWDGLSYGKGPGIWGEAQYNGPYVGLGLRRLLNQLRGDLPLRVFTHSSGAFVMSNALGDGSGGFAQRDMDEPFRLNAAGAPGYGFPAQLRDLRLAMLVAAAPVRSFAHYDQGRAGAVPTRLILGTSRKDIATSKFWGRCRWAGNTCMAIKPRLACTTVAEDLGIVPPQLLVVDFPRPAGLFRYHDHGVASYIVDAEWTQMMSALFDAKPPLPAGTTEWCDGIGAASST